MTYGQEEQALISLVERTYGVTGVDLGTELGDMQRPDGSWCYRSDHEHFREVFSAHYSIPMDDQSIYRKTRVWELWNLIDNR